MFIEPFHQLLKVDYLQLNIYVLLKINRDKIFDQLTKVEKGKYFSRIVEIYMETKQQNPCRH